MSDSDAVQRLKRFLLNSGVGRWISWIYFKFRDDKSLAHARKVVPSLSVLSMVDIGSQNPSNLYLVVEELCGFFERVEVLEMSLSDPKACQTGSSADNLSVRTYRIKDTAVSIGELINFGLARAISRFVLIAPPGKRFSASKVALKLSEMVRMGEAASLVFYDSESENYYLLLDIYLSLPYVGYFDTVDEEVILEFAQRVADYNSGRWSIGVAKRIEKLTGYWREIPYSGYLSRRRTNYPNDKTQWSLEFPAYDRTRESRGIPEREMSLISGREGDYDIHQGSGLFFDALPGYDFPASMFDPTTTKTLVLGVENRAIVSLNPRPLVSIVVPAYNAERTIIASLQSLAAQSYREIEVIIVDDCSADDTPVLCEAFIKSDTRFRLIRLERNRGTYWARNKGIRAATGSYVTFQDADDVSLRRRIESSLFPLTTGGRYHGTISYYVRLNESGCPVVWAGSLVRRAYISIMIRKAFFDERLGAFDCARGGADVELFERMLAIEPNSICEVSAVQYLALHRSTSLSNNTLTGSTATALPNSFQFSEPILKYRTAYNDWHDKIRSGLQDGFMCFPPTEQRPFEVPAELRI